MKIKFDKANITMSISILIVSIIFVSVLYIQFKTVENVNETEIETMGDEELREKISLWKSKYEETNDKLQENNSKINEYLDKIESNEEASEILDEELKKSQLILGTTDVVGEGVVITLTDTEDHPIKASDLIDLLNELRYAGAEAISINDVRIINTTDIVEVGNTLIMVGGQRLSSPYVVKAIGNQAYLSSILSLKNSGFIDKYNNSGKTVTLVASKKVEILKYNGETEIKYIKK